MKWKIFFGLGCLLTVAGFLSWHFLKTPNHAPKPNFANQATATTQLIPPQFPDKSMFLTQIKSATSTISSAQVSGLTVPHHLLAIDLIAQAFRFASAGKYGLVVLMSPDHFYLGKTDVSVSSENFSTVFGTISADTGDASELKRLPFVTEQSFFYREHGLGAELPFIKYYFPNAKILAVTIKESSSPTEINQLTEALKKIVEQNTLVIQSTDFSHYLTPAESNIRDQQTLQALQQGNPNAILQLGQPQNIDSTAAQYIQMRLQQEIFHSKLQILAHKNSQDYTTDRVTSSTSYIVEGWVKQ
jgi:AmmeMemoRadiSam system protein B